MKKILFLVFITFYSIFLSASSFRYLIFEVYDHYGSNCSTISEIQLQNSLNNIVSYSVPSIYDSATLGETSYWSINSCWGYDNLYDGDTYYVNNSTGAASTTEFTCSSSANAGYWARFALDLGSIKDVNKILLWAGSPEGRIPYFIDIWLTNSYSYSTNISARDNTGLTHIQKVDYFSNQTSVFMTTVNILVDPYTVPEPASFVFFAIGISLLYRIFLFSTLSQILW